jgi:predicted AAA+ superfamily ATPase
MGRLFEDLIKEWWAWKLPEIKPRELDLTEYHNTKVKKVLSVTGFRRVGKTFLLLDFARKIGQENCIYINFEDERIPQRVEILTELIQVIKELKGNKGLVLLLDEIQNIPGWSKWVRRVNETQNYSLIITGSSSKLSSKEIPTELRGRCISVEVFPLNFNEFLKFKNQDISQLPEGEKFNLLREYLIYGGFPEVVLVDEGKKHLVLDEYYRTFLTRDIEERYHPRHRRAIRDIIKLLLNSSYYTIGKLTNTLKSLNYKIGKSTVSNYIHWLEESFFLQLLEIHSPRVKDRLQHPKKVYFIDNFFISRFSSNFSQNLGRLMENFVGLRLNQKIQRNPGMEIYYWRDYYEREVDFIIRENFKVIELIQVTYASTREEIQEREIKSLIRASKELECNNLTLISWNFAGLINVKKIKIRIIPLLIWLLNE